MATVCVRGLVRRGVCRCLACRVGYAAEVVLAVALVVAVVGGLAMLGTRLPLPQMSAVTVE